MKNKPKRFVDISSLIVSKAKYLWINQHLEKQIQHQKINVYPPKFSPGMNLE